MYINRSTITKEFDSAKSRQSGLVAARNRWGLLFVSPFFILFAIFGLFPIIFSFILGFTDWNGRGSLNFIGIENIKLLLQDKVFWQSMRNGLIIFLLYTPIQIILSLVLAVVLNSERVRGFRLFRTIIFMPYITNMVAAGYVFQLLMNTRSGLFNQMLGVFFLPPVPWLDSPWGARVSLVIVVLWAWIGYHMIIMLAGLQTIPKDLPEAAAIDGANAVQSFFLITIPLMRPVILFSLVLSTIGSFNLFTELLSLFPSTGGSGPLNSTLTPGLHIYNQAFGNFRFGYASAIAYTYFILVFLITLGEQYFLGRDN
jgi:lactose/L-arabinose transport system permease protein